MLAAIMIQPAEIQISLPCSGGKASTSSATLIYRDGGNEGEGTEKEDNRRSNDHAEKTDESASLRR